MTSDLDLTYPRVPTFGLEQNSSKMKEIFIIRCLLKKQDVGVPIFHPEKAGEET